MKVVDADAYALPAPVQDIARIAPERCTRLVAVTKPAKAAAVLELGFILSGRLASCLNRDGCDADPVPDHKQEFLR